MDRKGRHKVLDMAMADAKVNALIDEETELEITYRQKSDRKLYFIINFREKEIEIPSFFEGGLDLLTGECVQKGEMLSVFGVKIIQIMYEPQKV